MYVLYFFLLEFITYGKGTFNPPKILQPTVNIPCSNINSCSLDFASEDFARNHDPLVLKRFDLLLAAANLPTPVSWR